MTRSLRTTACVLLVATVAAPCAGNETAAERLVPGTRVDPLVVVARINQRDDGQHLSETLAILVTDRSGRARERAARAYRRYSKTGKQSLIEYQSPASVRGTAFLTYDYAEDGREDDLWLYLPELRRTRRIAASERGQSFLGTDFTYENLKNETKVTAEDYQWATVGWQTSRDCQCLLIEGRAKTDSLARELGHRRHSRLVDTNTWLTRRIEYFDDGGRLLRTIFLDSAELVQGIWTPLMLRCLNHATGSTSTFTFSDVDYRTELADDRFTQEAMRRGGQP